MKREEDSKARDEQDARETGAPAASPGLPADPLLPVESREQASGYAVDGVTPAWHAEPQSTDQAQACIRMAAKNNFATIPIGGANFLDVGDPPSRYDLALRLHRLARIVDYQPADMTITVEAGVKLTALADILTSRGQWLPVDPPRPGQQTIGGLIAANLFGPCRVSQGRVRDFLLGVRVLQANGNLIKGGGRVAKNVAGYDLPKLYVGSLGSLGVIVEATLQVRPIPETVQHYLVATGGDLAKAAALALRVGDARLCPFALSAYINTAFPSGTECGLLVSFAGAAAEVEWQRERLAGLAREAGFEAQEVGSGQYEILRDSPLTAGVEVSWRVSVLPRFAGGIAATMVEEISRAGAAGKVAVLILPESGSIWLGASGVNSHAKLAEMTANWRRAAGQAGGKVVISRAPGGLKKMASVWGPRGAEEGLVRRLKTELDPDGLMSPGRFGEGL